MQKIGQGRDAARKWAGAEVRKPALSRVRRGFVSEFVRNSRDLDTNKTPILEVPPPATVAPPAAVTPSTSFTAVPANGAFGCSASPVAAEVTDRRRRRRHLHHPFGAEGLGHSTPFERESSSPGAPPPAKGSGTPRPPLRTAARRGQHQTFSQLLSAVRAVVSTPISFIQWDAVQNLDAVTGKYKPAAD